MILAQHNNYTCFLLLIWKLEWAKLIPRSGIELRTGRVGLMVSKLNFLRVSSLVKTMEGTGKGILQINPQYEWGVHRRGWKTV